ncbi:Complement C3 [Takifugu flavidus]|uniref:Complement C3 n=1 Tax=Takifugu flavidus TaxID=433684 RepID=A0A5C6MWX1_9TELE|nr:Complement C3 [Takifugu flavidus]
MFGLKVTGDPGATVGLVAVDKGVFVLNNKHLLNQQKARLVWDTVESYDTGCTPGGGKNGISVFSDAGLLFVSNTASATPHRQEYSCPAPSRKKRDTTLRAMTTSLANQYEDQLQRDCCLDGIRDSPLSYSCERRSEYIGDEVACVEAFLRCCKEMETKKEDDLQVALSEEDDSYMDSDEIVSRTQFPASWLWMDVKLPPCPETQPACPSTSMQKHIPLQDSITTWQFIGISLSRSLGICIAEPLEVIVRKDFFLDVKLPYFAVRGEQLQIKVLIYNYSPNPATVVVDLFEQQDLCSAAFKRGKHRQAVHVGRKTSLSVPFIVIPMKEGQYPIEVKAAVKDSMLSDGIKKTLRVVPDGIMVKVPKTVVINPEKIGEDGKQVEIINSRISPRDFVPNTPTSTQIYVTGRDQADKLENDINGESVGNLIYQPGGDGEENMIHLSLTVAATWYLDQTNQWEAVNIDRRNEALQHIRTGHLNQLTYRKTDGSFAAYPDQQSSTWLTAFVVKVLAMADKLVAVKRTGVCDAVEFLISRVQTRTGLFHEAGEVFHSAMMGDVLGTDSDASMTAFCLIAMQESQSICTHVTGLQASKAKAVVYLEMRLPTLINPYAVAIASYALANENKLRQDILFKFASPDSSHWQVPMGRVYTLEATAYSLLALIKSMAFEEATPVVRWLNKQQRVAGGFGSTQATILVYQALAEFWTSYKGPEYDLNVDILLPGRSKPDMYNFDRESRYTTRTSKMVSLYYALPKDKDCPRFDLHKDLERDANMSVLDIGLLTGFDVNTQDLSLLSKGRARTISKYSVNPPESDRGALIIYLDKISHKRPEEIKFRIHQKFKVGVMQPAAVSVYEHALDDSNQTSCVRFYHPERTSGQLLRLCRGDECTCAEENCSMQKKGNISNDERTAKACETQQFNKIDYVYKVRLQDFTKSLSTDVYTVRVLDVIKEGNNDVAPEGKERIFLGFPHCRVALDLKKDQNYLIMGASKDIHVDRRDKLYQYVLGERTWVEYWPTESECKTEQHRPTCQGMEELVREYTQYGCRQ